MTHDHEKGREGQLPEPPVNGDLMRQDFTAVEPNHKWATDLIEHPIAEGMVYCGAIKDLFPYRIAGNAVIDRMAANLAVAVLRTALARREPDGIVIVHADRGSQFRARGFQAVLRAAGHQGSMGRAASAGDNVAMESRWALSHRKVLNTQQWRPRAELHYTASYGIEHTCNGRGRQSGVGRLTPNWVRVSLHQECLSRSNLRDTTRVN